MRLSSKFASLVVAGVAFLSCRDSAFNAASKADTLEAYQQFVALHPTDENVDAAKARMAELEFEAARKTHTVVAYKRYLEAYPDSSKASAAQALLEGMRFNATQSKNTAAAWRQFLKDHPEGAHRDEAEKLLSAAELKEVGNLVDLTELNRIASLNPDDERGAKAAVRLDDQRFAKATSAAALYQYLKENPAGAHRDDARVRLLSLQLEGLVVSGRLAEAKAIAAKAPLASKIQQLEQRFKRAAELEKTAASQDEAIRRALPSYYLRSYEDLVKSLTAPDAMDRWQAAEELGALVDVKAIDPLLEVLRASRQPLVRQRAFESLGRVLHALPAEVADYEVATRVEAARENASDAKMVLTLAVLLDLNGQLDRAAPEYQRSFDAQTPDPVVLQRWAQIRQDRKQFFSSAVAARQLSLWAEEQAKVGDDGELQTGSVGRARELCAAVEAARFAAGVITQARKNQSEFAEDVAQFEVRANGVTRLAEAKLRDAELKMLEADARARKCGDDAVSQRLADAEKRRVEAVKALAVKKNAGLVLALAKERDPSTAVRTAAAETTK